MHLENVNYLNYQWKMFVLLSMVLKGCSNVSVFQTVKTFLSESNTPFTNINLMEAHMKRYLCEIIVCLHNKLLTIPRYANEIQHFSGPLSMLGLSTDKMRKHVLVFLTKLFYLKTRRYFILFTTEKLALYHCLSLEYILNHAIT